MSLDDLRKFQLPNGMKLLCRRNAANPTASFSFRLSTGSILEPVEKTGLASLAGSLITKGTDNKGAQDIAEAIDSLGLDLGFSTGKHTSSMGGRVLAEVLPAALKLAAEILSGAKPGEEELERMRQRILTGIQLKLDDPAAVASDKMMELIYGADHPYGKPFATALKTLPHITLEDILSYYREHVLPGAAIGVVVGDIELGEIEKIVKTATVKWQGGGDFNLQPADFVPLPENPRKEEIQMPGKTQSDIALGFQGIRRSDPDYYALQVGNTVLGRLGLGGRVGQRVRDKEGMAYYAFTSFDAGIGAGPYMFRAGVNPANIKRAVELALEEMTKAKKDGISQEEMDDAVTFLSGGMARQVETNSGMAAVMINQEIYGLGDDYYVRFPEILKSLILEDVNNALARHLQPQHYCLATAGPDA